MDISILTLFPEMFAGPLDHSIVGRAQARGLASVALHNIRDYAADRRGTVDDAPFGGGPGMVMKPEPLFRAVAAARADLAQRRGDAVAAEAPVVLLSPQGALFTQSHARALAARPALILVCGRYEGIDARVEEALATDVVSIGDYILTGGELPAMVVVDAVVRLLPGALGDDASAADESFSGGLLEGPAYTRPAEHEGMAVPATLLSGDHGAVARWRRRQALRRTYLWRPDLLATAPLTDDDRAYLREMEEGRDSD